MGYLKIKTILFDIGGVLVEFVGVKRLIEFMGGTMTREELSKRWLDSEYVRLFETGLCNTEVFAEGFVKEFNIDITPKEFIDEFVLFAKGFFPGAAELLQALRPDYTLACLSNINVVQWNGLCERIAIDKYFHYNFLSYEMGVMKPENKAYTYVIEGLGCDPNEIVFFDDTEMNVQAAVNAGMNAYRVLGFKELKDKLKGLSLI